MVGELSTKLTIPRAQSFKLALDPEEVRWIARAKAGDDAAYVWLMDLYRDRAVRLAAHILRRPDDAEDIVQEAFVKAFRSIKKFREDGRFYTWLYNIVVRCCVDRTRRSWWKSETAELNQDVVESVAGAPLAHEADTRMMVEGLLDQLTPPIRAALVLRELEGLDYEEIAQVLKIPVGTVRSRLSAARGRFRSLWESAMKEAASA